MIRERDRTALGLDGRLTAHDLGGRVAAEARRVEQHVVDPLRRAHAVRPVRVQGIFRIPGRLVRVRVIGVNVTPDLLAEQSLIVCGGSLGAGIEIAGDNVD